MKTYILSTNINTFSDVIRLRKTFNSWKPIIKWTVDLHDWERVLKVVSNQDLSIEDVVFKLEKAGFEGKELDH